MAINEKMLTDDRSDDTDFSLDCIDKQLSLPLFEEDQARSEDETLEGQNELLDEHLHDLERLDRQLTGLEEELYNLDKTDEYKDKNRNITITDEDATVLKNSLRPTGAVDGENVSQEYRMMNRYIGGVAMFCILSSGVIFVWFTIDKLLLNR